MGQVEQIACPQTGFNGGAEPVLQRIPRLGPGVAEQRIQDMRRAFPLQIIEFVVNSDPETSISEGPRVSPKPDKSIA